MSRFLISAHLNSSSNLVDKWPFLLAKYIRKGTRDNNDVAWNVDRLYEYLSPSKGHISSYFEEEFRHAIFNLSTGLSIRKDFMKICHFTAKLPLWPPKIEKNSHILRNWKKKTGRLGIKMTWLGFCYSTNFIYCMAPKVNSCL